MKILAVTPYYAYPPNSGGSSSTWHNLFWMSQLGVSIDLLTISEESDGTRTSPPHHILRNVFFCNELPQSKRPKHVASSISRCYTFQEFPLDEEYDYVWLDYEFVAPILENKTLRAKTRLLRIHNDEARFCLEQARASKQTRKFLRFLRQAYLLNRQLPTIHRQCDRLLHISTSEMARSIRRYGPEKNALLPPALVEREPLLANRSLQGCQVLFVGSLEFDPNRDAIRWYLRHIHARVCANPEYTLTIVGSSNNEPLDWLYALTRQHERIQVIVDAKELEPHYSASAAFINPVRYGTGVKTKCVHAVQNGLPVVSTPSGAEGSGFMHGCGVMLAGTSGAFASALLTVLKDKPRAQSLVESGQRFLATHYDAKERLRNILQIA